MAESNWEEELDASVVLARFLRTNNKNTRTAYEHDLKSFSKWVGVEDNCTKGAFELLSRGPAGAEDLVDRWKYYMEGKLSVATINRRLTSIRHLCKIAKKLRMIDWKLDVRGFRPEKFKDTKGPGVDAYDDMVSILSRETEEEKRLHEHPELRSPRPFRNMAMLRLLGNMALRREEVVSIDYEDVDFEGRRINLLRKGHKEKRFMPLSEVAEEAILEFVEVRGADPGPLFPSYNPAGPSAGNGRLTGRSLHRIVSKLGKCAGVDTWPHALRHMAITETLEANGGDYRKAADLAGHERIETTQNYDDNRGGHVGEMVDLLDERTRAREARRRAALKNRGKPSP